MKFIYFTSYAIEPDKIKERIPFSSEAGSLRMQYILKNIWVSRDNNSIVLLSQGHSHRSGFNHQKESVHSEYSDIKEIYLSYYGKGIFRYLSEIISSTLWILKNIDKEDVIISYNFEPKIAIPIILTKIIRKYKTIIEFEELYGHIDGKYKIIQAFCEKWGIKTAYGFITCSSETAKIIRDLRKDNPPVILSYGYPKKISPSFQKEMNPIGKLHLLYSGSLDENRGVMELVTLMTSVEDIAYITITGRGILSPALQTISQNFNNIDYKGFLDKNQFEKLILDCDICVHPTPINSLFSKFSFPSKVIFYLNHGKNVLSTKLDVLLNSPYRNMVMYYETSHSKSFRDMLVYLKNKPHIMYENTNRNTSEMSNILKNESDEFVYLMEHVRSE